MCLRRLSEKDKGQLDREMGWTDRQREGDRDKRWLNKRITPILNTTCRARGPSQERNPITKIISFACLFQSPGNAARPTRHHPSDLRGKSPPAILEGTCARWRKTGPALPLPQAANRTSFARVNNHREKELRARARAASRCGGRDGNAEAGAFSGSRVWVSDSCLTSPLPPREANALM